MKRLSLPHVPLMDAVRDPELLGAGLELWPKQVELLEGAAEHRLSVWALGRRSGKSTTAALILLWQLLLRPQLLERLRPGETGYGIVVATNREQARLIVRAALSIVERSAALAELVESTTEDSVRFANQTELVAFPCSSRAGRGWPLLAVALDEAGHLSTESEGFQAASRVWEALVPGTAQFADEARLVVASTPWGDQGLFPTLFEQVTSGEIPDSIAFQASTRECNPTIPEDFLEAERARDPISFAGEFEASFLESGGAYIPAERIEAAIADRGELDPSDCKRWMIGLDPSFAHDPAGVVVVGWNPDGTLRVAAAHSIAPPKRKPTSIEEKRLREDEVLEQVAAIARPFGGRIISDQYMATSVSDALTRLGCAVEIVNLGASTKTALLAQLRARIVGGTLELYRSDPLIRDLRALRSRYTAGQASVVTPRLAGSHCDVAIAAALAVHGFDRFGVLRGHARSRTNARDPGAVARLDHLDRVLDRPTRTRRWYDAEPGLIGRVF